MATQVKRTIKQSGGDHSTLASAVAWVLANYPNLVTSDVYVDLEIDGDWIINDVAPVTISGITTDSTHYINIYAINNSKNNGRDLGNIYSCLLYTSRCV